MNEVFPIALGILIPFIGTTLGAGCTFFVKNEISPVVQKGLLGFASGVMVAASVWSLLIPAMEMSSGMGRLAFVPAVVGLAGGMLFLLLLDHLIPHLHMGSEEPEGPKSHLARTTMLVLAVTLHNIPEGMAVGVVFAGILIGGVSISMAAAFALSIGIAIQNFPEGAIIALPLRSNGASRTRAFSMGVLSGLVEPIGAFVTVLLADVIVPVLPYLLSLAAGAMLYVVVEELIPESAAGEHSDMGTLGFAVGFMLMMVLDVALG
ncbi:MAG: ZIP family metal transporter [Clostridiales bacterium]|nr:ZIP family metal transporter [Clostridiales bacterium]